MAIYIDEKSDRWVSVVKKLTDPTTGYSNQVRIEVRPDGKSAPRMVFYNPERRLDDERVRTEWSEFTAELEEQNEQVSRAYVTTGSGLKVPMHCISFAGADAEQAAALAAKYLLRASAMCYEDEKMQEREDEAAREEAEALIEDAFNQLMSELGWEEE